MRKTIQYCSYGWRGPTITSKVIGMRRVRLGCGVTLRWYEIERSPQHSYSHVSVPMRLRVPLEDDWLEGPDRFFLEPHIIAYKSWLSEPARAELTDVTKAEERLLAKMMMLYEMGVE